MLELPPLLHLQQLKSVPFQVIAEQSNWYYKSFHDSQSFTLCLLQDNVNSNYEIFIRHFSSQTIQQLVDTYCPQLYMEVEYWIETLLAQFQVTSTIESNKKLVLDYNKEDQICHIQIEDSLEVTAGAARVPFSCKMELSHLQKLYSFHSDIIEINDNSKISSTPLSIPSDSQQITVTEKELILKELELRFFERQQIWNSCLGLMEVMQWELDLLYSKNKKQEEEMEKWKSAVESQIGGTLIHQFIADCPQNNWSRAQMESNIYKAKKTTHLLHEANLKSVSKYSLSNSLLKLFHSTEQSNTLQQKASSSQNARVEEDDSTPANEEGGITSSEEAKKEVQPQHTIVEVSSMGSEMAVPPATPIATSTKIYVESENEKKRRREIEELKTKKQKKDDTRKKIKKSIFG